MTGDTVGDPFKDTSGQSMNILIKLTCLVGLVIAPILGDHGSDMLAFSDYKNINKSVIIEVNEENPDESTLIIKTKSNLNGLIVENTEKCYGSKAELLLKVAQIKEDN